MNKDDILERVSNLSTDEEVSNALSLIYKNNYDLSVFQKNLINKKMIYGLDNNVGRNDAPGYCMTDAKGIGIYVDKKFCTDNAISKSALIKEEFINKLDNSSSFNKDVLLEPLKKALNIYNGILYHELAHVFADSSIFTAIRLAISGSQNKIINMLEKEMSKDGEKKSINSHVISDDLRADIKKLLSDYISANFLFGDELNKRDDEVLDVYMNLHFPKAPFGIKNNIAVLHNILIDIFIENSMPLQLPRADHAQNAREEAYSSLAYVRSIVNDKTKGLIAELSIQEKKIGYQGVYFGIIGPYIDPRENMVNDSNIKTLLENAGYGDFFFKEIDTNINLLHQPNITKPTYLDLFRELYLVNKKANELTKNQISQNKDMITYSQREEAGIGAVYFTSLFNECIKPIIDMMNSMSQTQQEIQQELDAELERIKKLLEEAHNISKDNKLKDFIDNFPNSSKSAKQCQDELKDIKEGIDDTKAKSLIDEAIKGLENFRYNEPEEGMEGQESNGPTASVPFAPENEQKNKKEKQPNQNKQERKDQQQGSGQQQGNEQEGQEQKGDPNQINDNGSAKDNTHSNSDNSSNGNEANKQESKSKDETGNSKDKASNEGIDDKGKSLAQRAKDIEDEISKMGANKEPKNLKEAMNNEHNTFVEDQMDKAIESEKERIKKDIADKVKEMDTSLNEQLDNPNNSLQNSSKVIRELEAELGNGRGLKERVADNMLVGKKLEEELFSNKKIEGRLDKNSMLSYELVKARQPIVDAMVDEVRKSLRPVKGKTANFANGAYNIGNAAMKTVTTGKVKTNNYRDKQNFALCVNFIVDNSGSMGETFNVTDTNNKTRSIEYMDFAKGFVAALSEMLIEIPNTIVNVYNFSGGSPGSKVLETCIGADPKKVHDVEDELYLKQKQIREVISEIVPLGGTYQQSTLAGAYYSTAYEALVGKNKPELFSEAKQAIIGRNKDNIPSSVNILITDDFTADFNSKVADMLGLALNQPGTKNYMHILLNSGCTNKESLAEWVKGMPINDHELGNQISLIDQELDYTYANGKKVRYKAYELMDMCIKSVMDGIKTTVENSIKGNDISDLDVEKLRNREERVTSNSSGIDR